MPPWATSNRADAVVVGAGEGSFAVSEQLALDQVLGQGAAIDGHKRHVGPQALVVHGPRHQFLAGAGLAANQHGRVVGATLAISWRTRCMEALSPINCGAPSMRSSCRLRARYLLVSSRF